MDTPEALRAALAENSRRPYGLPRTTMAETIVETAERFDDPALLTDTLLQLMTAYEFAGEHRKAPVAFARLLELLDGSPETLDEEQVFLVLWRYKWVVSSLIEVPEVPLDAIRGLVDRMSGHYRSAGHGQQPVAAIRHRLAAHTGTGVRNAFELWVTRPRERLTDCAACETRRLARHHLDAGDDELALAVLEPVLTGESSCAEEPQTSAAHALLPLLREGRADEARSHHLTSYRAMRGATGMLAEIGLHLEFCALSGNEPRGLEILSDSRPLFAVSGAPLGRLGFLTGTEVLLRRLTAQGHGGVTVPGPVGADWTAATLLAHVAAEAGRLAAAFDARNGTGRVGDHRAARLRAEPIGHEPVSLGLRAASPLPVTPVPAGAAVPGDEEDLTALVEHARRLTVQNHPGGPAAWDRVAALVAADEASDEASDGNGTPDGAPPAGAPDDRLRADLAAHRAHLAHRAGDLAGARAELDRAAGLYAGAGLPGRVRTTRARALTLRDSVSDAEAETELDALLAADAAANEAPEPGSEAARERLVLLHTRAFLAFLPLFDAPPEPPAGARQRFETALGTLLSEAERLAVPHQTAAAHRYAADLAVRDGRWEDAAAGLRACLDALETADRPWDVPEAQFVLAQVLMQQGRSDEAAELLNRALAGAARHGDPGFPAAPAHRMLGSLCAEAGDRAGAVRHLSQAADRYERDGDPNGAADARLGLAGALAGDGRHAEAAAVLESALGGDGAGLDERLAAQLRLTLARRLADAGEHRPAAEEFLRLADTLATWEEDRHLHTMAACEAATALLRAGSTEAAGTAYRRALTLHETAPHADAVLAAARAFAEAAGGPDEALPFLATADELLPALPSGTAWHERGVNQRLRARVLARAGRAEEALAAAESAVAAFSEGGAAGETGRAEASRLAALVEADQLGRPEAASARLGDAIARCRAAGERDAAQVLERLRARIDRDRAGR